MKTAFSSILILAAFVLAMALALASCALQAPPEWQGTPNPLDTPEMAPVWRPASEGNFGHQWMYR